MSQSPSDQLKLTPQEVSNLTSNNLILPPVPGSDKRKVSATFLQTPSSSSSPVATVRHISSVAPGSFVDLPTHLDSAATLQICGFDAATATAIYSAFLNKPPHSTNTLLAYAIAHMQPPTHPQTAASSRQQLLARVGVSDEMRRVFEAEEHQQILQTEPLHFWVVHAIRGNYRAVQSALERVKQAAGNISEDGQIAKAQTETPAPSPTVSGPLTGSGRHA